jgi:hypothetical protein
MEVTLHHVTVTITAIDEKEAYSHFCDGMASIETAQAAAGGAVGVEYTTTDYSVSENLTDHDQLHPEAGPADRFPVSELYPEIV